MWRILIVALAALLAAACAQVPPSPQEIQAKKYESVPGKAVIYLVRGDPDLSTQGAPLTLDNRGSVTTYPGTFVRWVVDPGPHTISGMFGDSGKIELQTAAGSINYVRQSVTGVQTPTSFLQAVGPQDGQGYVNLATMIPVQ